MARRGEHSREEIRDMAMEAAEQIIVEQGHDGLTARKVASEIGYTVGTLYLNFENLDDLIMHVNARTLDRLYQVMTSSEIQNLTDEECLIRLGQIYIHFAYGDPHLWALIFEHRLPEGQPTPEWYVEKIMQVFAVVEETLKPFAPHQKENEISQAARTLWAGVHGICILGVTQKLGDVSEDSVQGLARSLIVNYLSGFANTGKP
ncbi:MAG: TetR/AcrR family transcriptional regulator [Candidatus Thiodiazotropha sp. (ex Lucinoma borealis)]|nr:TetR/AcrR family transcriptional regulator [Candidatus Thiodiazotropha sp. (ex Lucinoma borealis)]